jgi:hypothetical protein
VLATGIGLATEYNASHKASKSPSRPVSDAPPKDEEFDSDRSTDLDEENWELDDVQRETAPDALSGQDGRDDEVFEGSFKDIRRLNIERLADYHAPPSSRNAGLKPIRVALSTRMHLCSRIAISTKLPGWTFSMGFTKLSR